MTYVLDGAWRHWRICRRPSSVPASGVATVWWTPDSWGFPEEVDPDGSSSEVPRRVPSGSDRVSAELNDLSRRWPGRWGSCMARGGAGSRPNARPASATLIPRRSASPKRPSSSGSVVRTLGGTGPLALPGLPATAIQPGRCRPRGAGVASDPPPPVGLAISRRRCCDRRSCRGRSRCPGWSRCRCPGRSCTWPRARAAPRR
jgi:hypothetical protein